jgi:hypothetical protein
MTLPADLSKLLGTGENPNGMVAQTANGTLVDGRGGDGYTWRDGMMADGPRWNEDPRIEAPNLTPGPAMVKVPRGKVMVSGHMRRKPR